MHYHALGECRIQQPLKRWCHHRENFTRKKGPPKNWAHHILHITHSCNTTSESARMVEDPFGRSRSHPDRIKSLENHIHLRNITTVGVQFAHPPEPRVYVLPYTRTTRRVRSPLRAGRFRRLHVHARMTFIVLNRVYRTHYNCRLFHIKGSSRVFVGCNVSECVYVCFDACG